VKSSNRTFINSERLSRGGYESEPFELKSENIVVGLSSRYKHKQFLVLTNLSKEFGIDIVQVGEDNKTIIHHKTTE
jgi:hypothetical protein